MSALVPADLQARMVAFRRDLHRHPELSWQEDRTAGRIADRLTALGLAPRRVAGTGVVAELPGRGGRTDGPLVALRADTDALPIQEETGLAFASDNPGVMHACGHDGHTSMLLGAVELLLESPPPRPVRVIWQPAEELGSGARRLVEAGVLDGVAMIFGGHVDCRYPAGTLVVTEGAVNASTDAFRVEIHGRGGHGARPQEALDAVVVGSLLVTALQSVVSRELDPDRPAVLSVGSFHAGEASNIIAGLATLEGTLRAQEPAVRAQLRASLARVVAAVGQLHGARMLLSLTEGTPALVNRPAETALAAAAARAVVGEAGIFALTTANMGGEDFAFFLERVRGCYIRFGVQAPDGVSLPAHSGRFDIDERVLSTGAAWFAEVARRAGHALARSL